MKHIALFSLALFSFSAQAADTVAPSVPTGATATAASATQINLTWTASTDNVGVTGYQVDRCTGASCTNFVQIATPTTNPFNNTGLSPSTTYRYRVRARDAVPNWSAFSSIVTRATPADTAAPSVPTNFTATPVSTTQINLSWTVSTDNVAVTGYQVDRCTGASCTNFAQIATPTTTSFNDTGRTASTTYRYRVRARDAAPNWSAFAAVANATTLTPDTTAPSVPTGFTATAVSTTQINLSWTASTDNVTVTGYQVDRCTGASCTTFSFIATPTTTSFNDTGRTAGTTYRYRVRARDAVPNWSAYTSIVNAATLPLDASAPSVPTGLAATPVSSTQINLTWSPSTDNVGVTGYQVDRCAGTSCTTFVQIATPVTNSFSDAGRAPSTTYRYRVRARDAVPNWSAFSSTVNATTFPPPDMIAPTVPANLSVTVLSSSRLKLIWTPSTDNVGVTTYLIERCAGLGCSNFTPLLNVPTTPYIDMNLTPVTSYTYRLRASDAANNLSSYSNSQSAQTSSQYGPVAFTYTYDNLGRIARVEGSDGSVVEYQYDQNGNITTITRN